VGLAVLAAAGAALGLSACGGGPQADFDHAMRDVHAAEQDADSTACELYLAGNLSAADLEALGVDVEACR
jgi:hypothetical protein